MVKIMADTRTDVLNGVLGTVRSVADAHISAELVEMRRRADVHRAVRQASGHGLSVDELSDATGLRPAEIRRILEQDKHGFDVDALAGL